MENHDENATWHLVDRQSLPKGSKVLRTKWVYDDKKGAVRYSVTRARSDLVNRTFILQEGPFREMQLGRHAWTNLRTPRLKNLDLGHTWTKRCDRHVWSGSGI
jgi:hypothetical protein